MIAAVVRTKWSRRVAAEPVLLRIVSHSRGALEMIAARPQICAFEDDRTTRRAIRSESSVY
jgi:hypothetical protein